ncbi:hypothetical protein OIDMADRAFT_36481 [Oidiodendron maius Zn]|uniref:Uncharacterized protein n=1 Tax=Oidiodendron maius (strain Zn) TaxID=913774 RepID=A0A0C3G8V0_OIDMZ|nr:hypothetical protein OIDMADRAFT_36481 [Oidiodendron maius Zn]
MRIAIAGAGDLARYLAEELLNASHEVVVLSRRAAPWFERKGISLRLTDYSVPSLIKELSDCEGLVSAILDYSMRSATVHLALLEACRQSPRCKKYIPSEYAGNTDEFPDQPSFYFANHEPVRKALREQNEVMWTLFNLGWLTDYLVPSNLRYIKDIGEYHPINLSENTFKIPGTGEEPIGFTSARDAARAIVRLMSYDEWEPIIYVCGETATWNKVKDIIIKRGGNPLVSYRPKEMVQRQIDDAESYDKVTSAQYEMWSISGAGLLPQEKLDKQRAKYFDGLKFRTIEEFLDDADCERGTTSVAL